MDESLPIDALIHLLPFLQAVALRLFGICSSQLLLVLKTTPAEYQRACELVKWRAFGGGAYPDAKDVSVAVGSGSWYPGGAAVAELPLSSKLDTAFRFVLETSSRCGDLLFGLTRCFETCGEEQLRKALASGYEFILGRELAPASIFYCGSDLSYYSQGDGTGSRIDCGPRPGIQADGRLVRVRNPGEWVEFNLSNGVVSARDFQGNVFEWRARLQPGEIWRPTIAWTGSKACVRILRRAVSSPGMHRSLNIEVLQS